MLFRCCFLFCFVHAAAADNDDVILFYFTFEKSLLGANFRTGKLQPQNLIILVLFVKLQNQK